MAEKNIDKIASQILEDIDDDFNDIEDDATDNGTVAIIADQSLLVSSDKQYKEELAEYDKRDKLYTSLLGEYISSSRSKTAWNKVYKCIFFAATMLILIALVGFPIAITLIIVLKEQSNLAIDLSALACSVIGIISAIIILPKIIAQHLFPTNEDEHMIELVKNMQVNDSKIREALKEKKK